MATPGPKPKPVEQAKRDGTHKSRIPNPPLRTGVEAKVSLPENFNAWQKTAWTEIVSMLTDLDVLDSADAAVVETAAAMLGRMREARHELNHTVMVEVTQRGAEAPSAYWRIEREAGLQVAKLLAELGLTPSARARLANSGTKSQKPEDAFDAFMGEPGRLKVLEGGK